MKLFKMILVVFLISWFLFSLPLSVIAWSYIEPDGYLEAEVFCIGGEIRVYGDYRLNLDKVENPALNLSMMVDGQVQRFLYQPLFYEQSWISYSVSQHKSDSRIEVWIMINDNRGVVADKLIRTKCSGIW